MAIGKEALGIRISRLETYVRHLNLMDSQNIKGSGKSFVQELLQRTNEVSQISRVVKQYQHSTASLYQAEARQLRGQSRFDQQRARQSHNDKQAYLGEFADRLRFLLVRLVDTLSAAMQAQDPTDHKGKSRTQLLIEYTNEWESFYKSLDKMQELQQKLGVANPVGKSGVGLDQCIANTSELTGRIQVSPQQISQLRNVPQPGSTDVLLAIVCIMRLIILFSHRKLK